MNICLQSMTRALCQRFFRDFTNDPDIFSNRNCFTEYVFTPEKAQAHWERQQKKGRIHLAVMLNGTPIGEIVLKDMDPINGSCALGIHMQNDSVKNKGYGTKAEILALEYAFTELNINTVYADALIHNTRSRHVLEKAGFRETHRSDTFVYYICSKETWCKQRIADTK